MNRLVRTELLKLRTTRTTVLLTVVALGFAALLGFANAGLAGEQGNPDLGTAGWVENVLAVSTIPAAVALLLGILLAAGEHQHQTATTTFLVTPRRSSVVAAKAVAAAFAGAVMALAMMVVCAAGTAPTVVAERAPVEAFRRGTAVAVLGLLVASAMLGALGVLLGLLLRSQVAAAVTVVAWFTVVEGVADTLAGGGLRRWLPGGAAADLAGSGGQAVWTAALVVAAWTAAAALVATPAVARRDVT